MYVSSIKSAEKMIHNEGCRFAKMIAAHNRKQFSTVEEACLAGRCFCIHCSPIMKQIPSEMVALQPICEANRISILFEPADGTLEIVTPKSSWKLAADDNSDRLLLFHKNTAKYDNGSSPYAGYHFQGLSYKTIFRHIQYIINHDAYQNREEDRRQKGTVKGFYYIPPVKDKGSHGTRRIAKIRNNKRHFTARQNARYAAGM